MLQGEHHRRLAAHGVAEDVPLVVADHGCEVVGEVIVESIVGGVSVMGSVNFSWEGDCRRCLELTGGSMDVDIAEIFQIGAPEDSELIGFDGDQIDLVPLVRDAALLSLPLAPLCGNDCAGPDPDRYPAITVEQSEQQKAAEAAEVPDPRWAALDQLKLDDNSADDGWSRGRESVRFLAGRLCGDRRPVSIELKFQVSKWLFQRRRSQSRRPAVVGPRPGSFRLRLAAPATAVVQPSCPTGSAAHVAGTRVVRP